MLDETDFLNMRNFFLCNLTRDNLQQNEDGMEGPWQSIRVGWRVGKSDALLLTCPFQCHTNVEEKKKEKLDLKNKKSAVTKKKNFREQKELGFKKKKK